jgi:RHS repeat-associated protein
VSIADSSSTDTVVTFTDPGRYEFELKADDGELIGSDRIVVEVISSYTPTPTPTITPTPRPQEPPMQIPGCIANPANEARLSDITPITLKDGVSLTNITVEYWQVNNPNAYTILRQGFDAVGGETLANFDPTLLANDSYTIRVAGNDSTTGTRIACGIMVTVHGENKPGRVTLSTVDFTIPVAGIPITVGRSYDSLERNINSDFGYGWSLVVGNPRVEIDAADNVTITLPNGKRSTFYFSPAGFPLQMPQYIAEPGTYGTLSANGCALVAVSGDRWFCFLFSGSTPYHQSVSEITYTDPYGVKYRMGIGGKLISITDLNGNILYFDDNGIRTSAGANQVIFDRGTDGVGPIERIIDFNGVVYTYQYDSNGDLIGVSLPSTPNPIRYTYETQGILRHLLKTATDPNGNPIFTTSYYPDGRLQTVTDVLGTATTYTYNLTTYTTVTTVDPINPNDPIVTTTEVRDAYGRLRQSFDANGQLTTYAYADTNGPGRDNLTSVINPLNERVCYGYDGRGNRTTVSRTHASNQAGCNNAILTAAYNNYGGPSNFVDGEGRNYRVAYDPTKPWLATNVQFQRGTTTIHLGGFTWTAQGSIDRQTDANGITTDYDYDAYGNVIQQTVLNAGNTASRTTQYTYDLMGRAQTMLSSDQDGNPATQDRLKTLYTYDGLGRILSETQVAAANESLILGKTTYQYDANGNRTHVTVSVYNTETGAFLRDEVTVYIYDAANRVTRITQPDGGITERSYDYRGNVIEEAVLNGAERIVTRYGYDNLGRMTQQIRYADTPYAAITTYTYDATGRQLTITDPNGVITTNVYEAGTGRLITVWVDRGAQRTTTTYEYLNAANPTQLTRTSVSSPGLQTQTTAYQYDEQGRLFRTTNGAGSAQPILTENLYQNSGRQWATKTTPSITSTIFSASCNSFDGFGQVLISVNNCNLANPQFNFTENQTADYYATLHVYQPDGKLDFTRDIVNAVSAYDYNLLGQSVTLIQGEGATPNITRSVYDSSGRTLKTIDAAGREMVYGVEYLATGRRETSLALGDLADATDDQLTTQTFDLAGRMTASTDAKGNTTTYTYHPGTMLLHTVTNPANETVTYTYTPSGLIQTIANGNNHTTTFNYSYGLQTQKIWPDGKCEKFTYDAFGRMIRHDLAADTCETSVNRPYREYQYDVHGRQIQEAYFDPIHNRADIIATTYDYLGNPDVVTTSQRVPMGGATTVVMTSNHDYDALQRVIKVTHTYPTPSTRPTEEVTYSYFADGNRRSMQMLIRKADGTTTITQSQTYAYDQQRRLISVTDQTATPHQTTTYTYNSVGTLNTIVTPNDVTTTHAYDPFHRLRNLTYTQGAQTLTEFEYRFDKAGNRTCVIQHHQEESRVLKYTYDAAYRLASEQLLEGSAQCGATNVTRTTSYTYDDAGNRLSEVITGTGAANTTYTYNANDQLTTLSKNVGGDITTTTYQYDTRGNLTQSVVEAFGVVNDVTTTYRYNARDLMTQVNINGHNNSTEILYAYNHRGQRIQEYDGSTTHYQWDALSAYGDVVSETDNTGALQVRYLLGEGRLIAQTRGAATHYFISDALGTTYALTNPNGNITNTYTYSAFGQMENATTLNGAGNTGYLFTGQQFDAKTGLYHLRARQYDPSNGRFLARDTWAYDFQNPVELNRYVYAIGNPVNYADPSGYVSLSDFGVTLKKVTLKASKDRRVVGGAIGAVTGATVASIYSIGYYAFASAGGCGTATQSWVQNMITFGDFIKGSVIFGAAYGAAIGSGTIIGQGIAGTAGTILGVAGVLAAYHEITKDGELHFDDPNDVCKLVEGFASFGFAVVSGMRAYPAVQLYRAWQLTSQNPPSSTTNPPIFHHSGQTRPPVTGGTPNSVYTWLKDGRSAYQNWIYDQNGNVIGHVDFKNHGNGALSGHGHRFSIPGNPSSGHGNAGPHIPWNQLPSDWKLLPPGVPPQQPIGT